MTKDTTKDTMQQTMAGRRGGPARAAKLSPEERRKIARKAARARWAKRKKKNS